MNFEVDQKDKFTQITAKVKKLDASVSSDLKSDIVFYTGKGEKNLVINLKDVQYIDSSGLSAILIANRQCKNAGGVLIVTGVSESVMKLISISQLDNILNIIQNPAEIEDFIVMESIENELNNKSTT